MIRWCAYCQNYLGECEPFDDFNLSHGICRECSDKDISGKGDAVARVRPLMEFFKKLRGEVRNGITPDPAGWVKQASGLGIKPHALLLGVMQPALHEIGQLWSKGEIPVAIEHRFSSFSENVVDHLFQYYPELGRNRQSAEPDILLTNADGNYHTLGLKFLEVGLLSEGLKTFTVLPGLPEAEILALVRKLRPAALGLSIAMPEQAEPIKGIPAALAGMPEADRPILLVGGFPVKRGLPLPAELEAYRCKTLSDVPVGRLLGKKAAAK